MLGKRLYEDVPTKEDGKRSKIDDIKAQKNAVRVARKGTDIRTIHNVPGSPVRRGERRTRPN